MTHPRAPMLDAPPLVRYGIPSYVLGETPAAGAAFRTSVPGQNYVRLVTVFCRLVTDATVEDRGVFLEYLDGAGNRFAIAGAPVTQSALSTNDYSFQAQLEEAAWPIDGTILVPLAPVLLLPTFSWRLSAENLQAGDAISRVRYIEELFYTGEPLALRDGA